jgi:hypothetical protein
MRCRGASSGRRKAIDLRETVGRSGGLSLLLLLLHGGEKHRCGMRCKEDLGAAATYWIGMRLEVWSKGNQ